MKKIISLLLVAIFAFSLTACGDSESGKEFPLKTDKSEKKAVKECILNICNADDADEIKANITEDDDSYVENIFNIFPDNDYTVTAEKIGDYKNYVVYNFTIRQESNSDFYISSVEFLLKKDGRYLIENNQEAMSKIYEKCICEICDGSGSVTIGGNVCGICAGTGVQYYPNSYYDVALNMWMGETRACSGCGGSGGHGNGSTTVCNGCNGDRVVLD